MLGVLHPSIEVHRGECNSKAKWTVIVDKWSCLSCPIHFITLSINGGALILLRTVTVTITGTGTPYSILRPVHYTLMSNRNVYIRFIDCTEHRAQSTMNKCTKILYYSGKFTCKTDEPHPIDSICFPSLRKKSTSMKQRLKKRLVEVTRGPGRLANTCMIYPPPHLPHPSQPNPIQPNPTRDIIIHGEKETRVSKCISYAITTKKNKESPRFSASPNKPGGR